MHRDCSLLFLSFFFFFFFFNSSIVWHCVYTPLLGGVVQFLSHVWLFCEPTNCSLPGSSVHGILQARILEWVGISYSRISSGHRDWTCVSCISCSGRQILHYWDTWEAHCQGSPYSILKCEQIIRWVFFNLTHLPIIYLKVIDTLSSVSASG